MHFLILKSYLQVLKRAYFGNLVEVFNTEAIVWTSGFLPPGKRAGSLELYDTSAVSLISILIDSIGKIMYIHACMQL